MNNPFSQQKIAYKIYFEVKYKFVELFENFFPEDIPGICTYEVYSTTIEPKPDDIWSLEVFYFNRPDFQTLKNNINIYADKNNANLQSSITIQEIEDKDWVSEYQSQLQPIILGDFYITSELVNDCNDSQIPIIIEASRAFGTGDHETTSLCIEAMNNYKNSSIKNVFDIGTGSGILSFVAAKIWPSANIMACDLDETSVEIACHNSQFNNCNITFFQNSEDGFNIPRQQNQFDLIVANILCNPLISMASDIKEVTAHNSIIILSGFLDYQVPEILKAYSSLGFKHLKTMQKEKWCALILTVV